ncbi:MAG: CRISPR-associated endonuclease Cas2 [Calditrichaeota bacterium]|nr:CRISPR-associated endonuclease Cas2 [Calditrichota bacterium]
MHYLICYDIEDDRQRSRMAHLLEGFGERVQKSVFECQLDPPGRQRLLRRIQQEFEPQGRDSIRIYPLCADCCRRALGMGHVPSSPLARVAYIHL